MQYDLQKDVSHSLIANERLRQALNDSGLEEFAIIFPPIEFCTVRSR